MKTLLVLFSDIIFLIGSLSWLLNGIFVFHLDESFTLVNQITAFLGGFFFLVGGIITYFNSLNHRLHSVDEEIELHDIVHEESQSVQFKWIGWNNSVVFIANLVE